MPTLFVYSDVLLKINETSLLIPFSILQSLTAYLLLNKRSDNIIIMTNVIMITALS